MLWIQLRNTCTTLLKQKVPIGTQNGAKTCPKNDTLMGATLAPLKEGAKWHPLQGTLYGTQDGEGAFFWY